MVGVVFLLPALMSSPLSLHTLVERSGLILPPAAMDIVRQSDVTFPDVPNEVEFVSGVLGHLKNFDLRKAGDISALRSAYHVAQDQTYRDMFRRRQSMLRSGEEIWDRPDAHEALGRRIATPREDAALLNLVKEAAQETGSTMPARVYILDSDFSNACADGKNPRAVLSLTRDLIRILDPVELKTVTGHELNEIEANSKYMGLGITLEKMASGLGISRFAHERELNADRRAAMTEGGAGALISALKKIDERASELKNHHRKRTSVVQDVLRELAPGYAKRFDVDMRRVGLNTHPPITARINQLRGAPQQRS